MFHIDLFARPTFVTARHSTLGADYNEEFDDVGSIIADICDNLEESQVAAFSVGGFGQEEWPVDVRSDLPIVLEQIGDVLTALKKRLPVVLLFPEQGIQRKVQITCSNSSCKLMCTSSGNWQPNREVVEIPTGELLQRLTNILETFFALATRYCSTLAQHPWFMQWHEQLMKILSDE